MRGARVADTERRARAPGALRSFRAGIPETAPCRVLSGPNTRNIMSNERNSSHRGTKSIARTPRGRSDRMLSLSPNSRLYTALVFSSVLE